MSSHRRGEVLAGPIGRELRRLARYHNDGRVMAALMGLSTPPVTMLASAVTNAAALCGVLSAEEEAQLKAMMFEKVSQQMKEGDCGGIVSGGRPRDSSGASGASGASGGTGGSGASSWERPGEDLKAKMRRQVVQLYGRLCDECGELGAQVQQRGGITLRRCAACQQAWYCSAECQKVAWKGGHKAECLAAQAAKSQA
jgi:hypothetical protein